MPYYPQYVLTSSELRPVWYPDKAAHRSVRLPGGLALSAGQVLYETLVAANCTQTLTFGGTITGGSIQLLFPNQVGYDVIGPIAYSGTSQTMIGNISTAFSNAFGPGNVTVTSPSSGVYQLAYTGDLSNRDLPTPQVLNQLTGTSPTIVAAQTQLGGGGMGFYEPYVAGNPNSVTAISFALLGENVKTSLGGDQLDQFGSTGEQTIKGFMGGYFLASVPNGYTNAGALLLAGLDTTLVPANGTFGSLGKWVSGGWNTYPALYPGSVLLIPGCGA